jgi:methylaspartate ammonia-lyase
MLPLLLGAVVTAMPKAVTLQIRGHSTAKIVASAASRNLNAESTCFTTAASAKDILVVTGITTKTGANSYTYGMDVRAQHVGTCTITFVSDANRATVHVTVTP